jgi:glucose-6-phosphate isomerase
MKEIESIPPHVRRLGEMREVLYDQDFAESAEPSQPVYYVHRDIPFSRPSCDSSLAELRYDVTLIPPMRLGQEYPKTHGHYHSIGPGGGAYAEIYEVLQGTVHVLLQKTERERVVDVFLIEGHPGDKLTIPPNHGHVLINPCEELLATGNLISRRCMADYELWRRRKGGAYYEVVERRFVKNPTYGNVPEMKMKAPHNSLSKELRLTDLLLKNPSDFRFLTDTLACAEEF